jgi:hypothetical protein
MLSRARFKNPANEPVVARDLDVVINGRNLGEQLDRPTVLAGVRARGGVLVVCPRGGPASVHRCTGERARRRNQLVLGHVR